MEKYGVEKFWDWDGKMQKKQEEEFWDWGGTKLKALELQRKQEAERRERRRMEPEKKFLKTITEIMGEMDDKERK